MSSYLTSTQRIINLPNDTTINPAIYLMAVGGELLEGCRVVIMVLRKTKSVPEKQKSTQQNPKLLGDGFARSTPEDGEDHC